MECTMCETDKKPNDIVTLKISFSKVCSMTVYMLSVMLLTCLVTGLFFSFERITETVCNVTNSVPSVSAIIGVSPQRYLWRVGIALHTAPRFAMGFMYLQLYSKIFSEPPNKGRLPKFLYRLVFLLYVIETASLVLVSYISNKENYPMHEKIFIIFMASCVSYQLLTLIIFHMALPNLHKCPKLASSYRKKKASFAMLLVSTSVLLGAFFQHRAYCTPGAFSVFSLAEYFIMASILSFHITAVDDFNDSYWSVQFRLSDVIKQS